MKRFVLLLVAMLSFALMMADAPQSEITFTTTTHDFGKFSESKPVVSCKFAFKNTGDAPLIINQAIASCGCTVPTFTKDPIKPGEKGEITVTYNGAGRYPGHFKKIITVRSNAKTSLVRLYIQGEMEAVTPAK